MRLLAALGGDERLLDAWRREGFTGTVHSVFERVVNLVDARGTLASLAVRSLDHAPNTLRVDAASFERYGLAAGMGARTRLSILHVGEPRLALRFDAATAWRAQLPSYPGDDTRLRENLALLHARHLEDTLPATRTRAMLRALQGGDIDAVSTHGRALLGLGPGLTPSGDDFLVGLLAVLSLPDSPCGGLHPACARIVADAEVRTHAISTAALREAARGRVRETIQALMAELLAGPPARMLPALERVLAIGATSGRDIVAGIVCGLEANVEASARMRTAMG